MQTTVKDVPKVTEDAYRFVEEFNTVIQTHQPSFPDLLQLVLALVGEGQAHNWMKTTKWGNPERSIKLQLGDPPADLSDDWAHVITTQLPGSIPRAFPKPVDWNKIQALS